MDLSQQELPLTAYFPKAANKRTKPARSSTRPHKRRKSLVGDAQLPTPATATRKRVRSGCPGADDLPSTPTVSTSRRNIDIVEPNIAMPAPRTSVRRASKPVDDHPSKQGPLLACSADTFAEDDVFVSRSEPSARIQRISQSKTLEGQPRDGCVTPTMPVASSQSQYLLRPDATPKRNRCSRRLEPIISSQTQEERELSISMVWNSAVTIGLSSGDSPGRYTVRASVQTPHRSPGQRKSQRARAEVSSSAGLSCSLATKDALSAKSPSSRGHRRQISNQSPSGKLKTPQRAARKDLIEGIPPAYIQDSQTETESEPNNPGVLRSSLTPLEVCRSDGQRNLASTEDDSATEAESDTEFTRCLAEIRKSRQSEVPREDSPPRPVISPLVSPARPRIAAAPSIAQAMQQSTMLGAPGSCARDPSTMEQSGSLPSVVRDFIRMFPGDESYPADFPESLRV